MKRVAFIVMLIAFSRMAVAEEAPETKPDEVQSKPTETPDIQTAQEAIDDTWTAKGAALPQRGKFVLDIGAGWPEFRAAVHIGVMNKFTLAPRLTLLYGERHFDVAVGNSVGVLLRFNVYSDEKLNVALEGDPAFVWAYPVASYSDGFVFGLQFGLPAINISYRVIKELSIVTGLNVPIAVLFYDKNKKSHIVGSIPFLLRGGVEWHIPDSSWRLYYTNDIGVEIGIDRAAGVTETKPWFMWKSLFGFAYMF